MPYKFNPLSGKLDYYQVSPAPDLSGYIPYTGATAAVNLGSQNFLTTGTLGAGATTLTGNLTFCNWS
jgi:hypothetical protein